MGSASGHDFHPLRSIGIRHRLLIGGEVGNNVTLFVWRLSWLPRSRSGWSRAIAGRGSVGQRIGRNRFRQRAAHWERHDCRSHVPRRRASHGRRGKAADVWGHRRTIRGRPRSSNGPRWLFTDSAFHCLRCRARGCPRTRALPRRAGYPLYAGETVNGNRGYRSYRSSAMTIDATVHGKARSDLRRPG